MRDTTYLGVWIPETIEAIKRMKARRVDEEPAESGEEPEEEE